MRRWVWIVGLATASAGCAKTVAENAELEGQTEDDLELSASNEHGSSPANMVSGSRPTDSGPPNGDWQALHPCSDGEPRDPINVTELRVERDTLYIGVSHGGGCAEHRYGLCYEDHWLTSFPIQVGFHVLHDAGGDTCNALQRESLSFDLTPFKEAYIEVYGEAYGTDDGAATLRFLSCALEDGPPAPGLGLCTVRYGWGALDCGPPIGPTCPEITIPQAPEEWVTHATGCGFSFRAPDDVAEVDAQPVDSCAAEFERGACRFSARSGAFSGGLRELEYNEGRQIGQATIDDHQAKLVTATQVYGEPPYVAAAHFPDPFGAGRDADLTAELVILCETPEDRDVMRATLGSIRFD